ncbi:AsmA family protein [Pseudomaricurvus sp.]|uniref:AsmA family protein n=1 Tax=Pseudomaricurvus sp. TaxID=2004510 RepID=UPI003F6B5F11
MSLRRTLLILLATLCTLIVVVGLCLWFSDFRFLKPKIEAVVTESTGRQFRIDGDFFFKGLPTPTLLLEQVSLSSPDWGSQPSMLTAEKAYVEVDLWSLVSPPIVVRTIEVDNVNILHESNASDESNWAMGSQTDEPSPEPQSVELSLPVEIQSASVNNVQVLLRKPGDDDVEARLDHLTISGTTSDWQAEASGQFAETPVDFNAKVVGNHVVVNAKADEFSLTSQYVYRDQSVDLDASISTLDKIGHWLEIEDLPAEDLKLKGNVAVSDGNLLLNDVVASLSGLELRVDGHIDSANAQAELSVEASGGKLSYLKTDLPELPFRLKTQLVATTSELDLKSFTVNIDDNTITGNALIHQGDQPEITLQARSDRLDVTPFMAENPTTRTTTATTKTTGKPSSRYVFDDTPLPLKQRPGLQLDAQIQIGRLILPDTEVENVQLNIQNRQNQLILGNSFEGSIAGKVNYQLQLQQEGNRATLDIQGLVSDFQSDLLSEGSVPKDQIPVTKIEVDLQATGTTPRALASSLDGKLIASQGPGIVSNKMIDKFSGDILNQLFNTLNPFAKDDEFTNWECSVFAIDFSSGKGDISGFLLQSEKLMVVGGGQVDLNDETLNIEFNTKPRKGVGVSADMLVTPFVKLSGTLKEPSIGLNQKGLLLSGGAAFLTGGMSFLYTGLIDRAMAQEGQCEKALELVHQK